MIIGVGTDILEIERIEKVISRSEGFFTKVYTKKEQEAYLRKHKKVETLAGLFCAKEAVSKALGTGFREFSLCDIEILSNELGKPEVFLYGGAEEVSKRLGIKRIHVSISHSRSQAIAFAVAEGDEKNETTYTSTDE